MAVGSRPDAPVESVSDGREAFRAIYDREFDYVWHSLRRLGIPARDLPDVTHDVSGHSAHDVAHELAIPLKTVYSRLRTARARFVLMAHQVQLKGADA